jgi:hypothetical protein
VAHRTDFSSVNITVCFNDLSHTGQAVLHACAIGIGSTALVAPAACANASSVVLASIQSCMVPPSVQLNAGAGSINGTACASAVNNGTLTLGNACGGGLGLGLVQSAGCAQTLAEVAGLISDACPASPTATSDAAGTLSFAADFGSAAAALQDAQFRTDGDAFEVPTKPSADNCGLALSLEQFELQTACGIATNITELATGAQAACANSTALILPRITPACGTVADAKANLTAEFAVGVSQAIPMSCAAAAVKASNLMNTVCAPAGGNIFSHLVESPACDGAKATALGLVSTACPIDEAS